MKDESRRVPSSRCYELYVSVKAIRGKKLVYARKWAIMSRFSGESVTQNCDENDGFIAYK